MTDQSSATKQKILETARILFADRGFEGTSIREIAKAAGVNVASVNYHFSNKENLLIEILQAGHQQCSQEVRAFYEKNNPNLEETLIALFNFFLTNSHDLVSMFKIMMSTQHSQHLAGKGPEDDHLGPPGGKVLAEAIIKEVGKDVPEEDLLWALRSLFSHVVHTAILYHCCFKSNQLPFTQIADLEKNIRRLARVVLSDLRNN